MREKLALISRSPPDSFTTTHIISNRISQAHNNTCIHLQTHPNYYHTDMHVH